METANHEAGDRRYLVPVAQPDETALDIIRTETVISKLPRHILSKSGKRPEIRLEKFTSAGKLDLRWVVSFNELYGPARQLAYDLDTLIVDRAIEETFDDARRIGQPLPRYIPIGSLRDLCRKLNLEENGTNAAKIKRALQQNAGAVINAILEYRSNDGTEIHLDATFTCYGVFFTGRKLPDGRKADQTYISTTNEYHQVISTAPTRPLDYAYKAQLPPTPRRLYEILGFSMYGALKNNKPFAPLLYSDYCARAPHVRYFTFDQVKKQMYTVNKPHKESGYITSVKYEFNADSKGNPDWMMLYTPGPKARAEFAAVHGGKRIKISVAEPRQAGETERPKHTRTVSPQRKIKLPLQPQLAVTQEFIDQLSRRGVNESSARKELTNLPADFPVLDTLEYGDFQIDHSRGKIDNPPGFYISLLRDKIIPPPTFETAAKRLAREEAQQETERQRQEEWEANQNRLAAEEQAEEQKLDDLQARNPDRYQALFRQCEDDLYREFPSMKRFGKPDSSLHIGSIRSRMKRLLREQPSPEQGSDPISFLKPVAVLASATLAPGDVIPETIPPVAEEPAAEQHSEATASDPSIAAEDGGEATEFSPEPADRLAEPLADTTRAAEPTASIDPEINLEMDASAVSPNEESVPRATAQPEPASIAPAMIELAPEPPRQEQGGSTIESHLL